jgi:hypothetical protein
MVAVERAMTVFYVAQKYFVKDLALLERLYQNITANGDIAASIGVLRPSAIILLPMKGYTRI